MDLNADLYKELRRLFRTGVSVSELLRCIQRHTQPAPQGRKLASVLCDAFGLEPVALRAIVASDSFGRGEIRDSDLNDLLLPRIMEARFEWSPERERENEPQSWCDNVTKTPWQRLRQDAETYRCGFSEDGWQRLSENDRNNALMIETSRLMLSENVKLLSKLIERLQERLNSGGG